MLKRSAALLLVLILLCGAVLYGCDPADLPENSLPETSAAAEPGATLGDSTDTDGVTSADLSAIPTEASRRTPISAPKRDPRRTPYPTLPTKRHL